MVLFQYVHKDYYKYYFYSNIIVIITLEFLVEAPPKFDGGRTLSSYKNGFLSILRFFIISFVMYLTITQGPRNQNSSITEDDLSLYHVSKLSLLYSNL